MKRTRKELGDGGAGDEAVVNGQSEEKMKKTRRRGACMGLGEGKKEKRELQRKKSIVFGG